MTDSHDSSSGDLEELTLRTGYEHGSAVLDQWLKQGGLSTDPSLARLETLLNARVQHQVSSLQADLEHTRQTQQVLLEVVDKARRLTSAIAIYGGDTSAEPFGRERLELNRALARLAAAEKS